LRHHHHQSTHNLTNNCFEAIMKNKPHLLFVAGITGLLPGWISQHQPYTAVESFSIQVAPIATTASSRLRFCTSPSSTLASSTCLFGKKSNRKAGGGGGSGGKSRQRQPQNQEKQSVKEARFDASTRQFMFTLSGLTKVLPDKSKKILDNINVSQQSKAEMMLVVFDHDSLTHFIPFLWI
jgi:hypothetical protein